MLSPLITYATLTLDSTSVTTDSTLNLKGGNVGIGTNSPSTTLDVIGGGRINATSTTAFQIQSSSTGLIFDSLNNRLGIGVSSPADTLDIAGNVLQTWTGTGNAATLVVNAITTGAGLTITSSGSAAGLSSGKLFTASRTQTAGAGSFTGKIGHFNLALTYTGGGGGNDTGVVFDTSRAYTLNFPGGSRTVSGAVTSISDTATQTAGTLTHTADVLDIAQNYTSNTGAALNITTAGTGLALRVNDDGTLTDSTPFVVDASGNVGIGLTAPSTTLHVAGIVTLSNVAAPTDNPSGGYLYVQSGTLKYRGASGTVSTVATADYAEDLPVMDDVEKGDLVSLSDSPNPKTDDPTAPFLLQRSQEPYGQRLIGIVSPYAGDPKTYGFYQPIAMVGRVPAKVSSENGPIAKGDPITSSSIPGVGMRATKQGRIIGIALEPYSGGGVGKIMVFVNRTWYLPKEAKQDAKISQEEKGNLEPLLKAPAEVIEKLPDFVRMTGLKIKDKVVELEEMFIEKLSALEIVTEKLKARSVDTETITSDTIQLRDQATGDIYCTWIENGEWITTKGGCYSITTATPSTTSAIPSEGAVQPLPSEVTQPRPRGRLQPEVSPSSTLSPPEKPTSSPPGKPTSIPPQNSSLLDTVLEGMEDLLNQLRR